MRHRRHAHSAPNPKLIVALKTIGLVVVLVLGFTYAVIFVELHQLGIL